MEYNLKTTTLSAAANHTLNISGSCNIAAIRTETELEKLYARLLDDARLSYEIRERLRNINAKLSPADTCCDQNGDRKEPYTLLDKLFETRYTTYENLLACLSELNRLEEII